MAKDRTRRGPYGWLTPPQRLAIEERLRAGARVKEIVAQFGCSHMTVWRIRDQAQLMRRRVHHPKLPLGFGGAQRITRGVAARGSARPVAREPYRAPPPVPAAVQH